MTTKPPDRELDNGNDKQLDRNIDKASSIQGSTRSRNLLISIAVIALLIVFASAFWQRNKPTDQSTKHITSDTKTNQTDKESDEVTLPPEALAKAGIEIVKITERPIVASIKVTGTIQANAEQEQTIVSLLSGQVVNVYAALGQQVKRGDRLATIQSQHMGELQGQLLAAKSKLALATSNLELIGKTANRANIISAKAKLDLAEKTLSRQQRLLELGAGANKDVQAAETEHATAKAEYEYQSNIAISRELQTAENEREASRVIVEQLSKTLVALGADPQQPNTNGITSVSTPISGIVTKREVNSGAGIQEGSPLFAIANLSTVWVIANVPESQISRLQLGLPAEVKQVASAEEAVTGRVAYIDPLLNEETHTARVRVEVKNPDGRFKVGMFVNILLRAKETSEVATNQLMIPEEAIQRVGEQVIVFIPEEGEKGHFKVRNIKVGDLISGYRQILNGLKSGEEVVTKGSFTLKSQFLKGQFGEDAD